MKKTLLLTAALLGSMGAMAAFAADVPTDGQTYETIDGVKCVDLWMYEYGDGSFDNLPFANDNYARSAAIDINAGKVYVADYNNGNFYVFDLVTGEYEDAVTISTTQGGSALTGGLWCCQICFDDYGNLVAGSSGSGSSYMTFYTVDMTTGVATALTTLSMTEDEMNGRCDYFDAKGDVTGVNADGIIMCAPNTSSNVKGLCAFRWVRAQGTDTWSGGFDDGKTYQAISETSHSVTEWGTSSMLRMISADSEYFIIDGGNTYPTVYDMSGNMIGYLQSSATGVNGVDHFSIGDTQFVAFAQSVSASGCTSTVSTLPNGIGDLSGITTAWTLPNGGITGKNNSVNYRSVVAQEGSCEIEGTDYDGVYLLEYDDYNILGVYFIYSEESTGVSAVASEPAEKVEVARYDITGRQLPAPQKGVNIVSYSDGSVGKVIEK